MADELHGPYFAIFEADGTLRADEMGHPYVFSRMGPHDNHSAEGRTVERVFLVRSTPTEGNGIHVSCGPKGQDALQFSGRDIQCMTAVAFAALRAMKTAREKQDG